MQVSDDDLVRMYREGDPNAFDVLFDRYHRSVYGFARGMLDGTASAEEVMQEVFLAVARATGARAGAPAGYEPRGQFRAWIMRITRNKCISRLRAEKRRREALEETPFQFARPASPDPGPSARVEMRERLGRLWELIGELPERQREALLLYALEDMRYREIAAVLEVPMGTVKTLIHRGRAALARRLEKDEEG